MTGKVPPRDSPEASAQHVRLSKRFMLLEADDREALGKALRGQHLRFVRELALLTVLSACLTYLFAVPLKIFEWAPADRFALFERVALRFVVAWALGYILLTIIYYGTSYEVTPFRIFFPFLRKLSPALSFLKYKRPLSQLRDLSAEPDISEVESSEEVSSEQTVADVLSAAAESSASLAAKMERRINTHLILGVLVGGAGLAVWWMSFYYGAAAAQRNGLEFVIASAPRITILLFIELLAGFFLRQYRIGVEDLKYFLELRRRADAKRIAYSILEQLNDRDAKLQFVRTLMEEKSDTRLGSGETTTTLSALDKEQNEVLKGLAVVGEKLEAVAKVFKEGK